MNLTPEDKDALGRIDDLRAIPPDDNSAKIETLERDILACVHCGGKGWLEDNRGFWYVTADCGARGPWNRDMEVSVRLWNRMVEK